MEQFRRLFSIHNLQPLFPQPRNYRIRRRIRARRNGIRSVRICSRDRKRFAVEIILCQVQPAWGKNVRSKSDDRTDRCYQKRFE